jgi:hypothetical protein
VLKSFQTKIVAYTVLCLFFTSVTLMVNRVGISRNPTGTIHDYNPYEEDEALCSPIGLNIWFIYLTGCGFMKLFITVLRYQHYKQMREESIPGYILDLLIVNALLTGVFIKANIMYFS